MINNFYVRDNLSITYPITSRNIKNFIQSEKRTFASISISTEILSDKVMLINEIELIYNSDWQNRGITPLEIHQLQTNILKEQPPRLEKIIYSKYNVRELMGLPESVLNRFGKNHDDGCCALDILEEGDAWMDVYETHHPVNSLLLYAVANILISKYSEIPQNVPDKIAYVRNEHYNRLNGLPKIESIILVRLKSGQFDKSRMIANLSDVCSGNGLIATICSEYIQCPVFDSMANDFLGCPSAPPLGNITSCLNNIIYKDLLEKRLEESFPGILYSRWLDELVIVNPMNYEKPKIETSHIDNLLTELNIEGSSYDLHAADNSSGRNRFLRGQDKYIIFELEENGRLNVDKISRRFFPKENSDDDEENLGYSYRMKVYKP